MNKFILKKEKLKSGVSPLIAWVLLIGLSVSMGFLVVNWVTEVIPEPEADFAFCEDVSLFLISYGLDGNNMFSINLTNNGLFTINKWSFSLASAGNIPAAKWCEETREGWSLNPGENKLISFKLGEYSSLLCSDVIDFEEEGQLLEVAPPYEIIITPWISPISEEDKFNCNNKKLNIVHEGGQNWDE